MSVWASALPQLLASDATPTSSTRRYMPGAPEIYFSKTIDNSRIVRVADPEHRRELTLFTVAVAVLLMLTFVYLWQHFSAIEYGYKIEALRAQRDQITDLNKTLKLEEASLKDPERIDAIARSMGMKMPMAGQVQRMESTSAESGGPVMASAAGVSVVSFTQ